MSYTYQTSFTLRLSGLDGSDHHVPLEIVYDVSPGRPQNSEDPGQPPIVKISKATLTDSKGVRYRAHDWLWEILEGNDELGDELVAEANAADESAADDHADAMRREIRL